MNTPKDVILSSVGIENLSECMEEMEEEASQSEFSDEVNAAVAAGKLSEAEAAELLQMYTSF